MKANETFRHCFCGLKRSDASREPILCELKEKVDKERADSKRDVPRGIHKRTAEQRKPEIKLHLL